MVYKKIRYKKSGLYGDTWVTRWVDTDHWPYWCKDWYEVNPTVETRIKIETETGPYNKKEVHEVSVQHDASTSVSVETKPIREWEKVTPSTSRSLALK
ncbi:hypothetical protein DMENIID0001_074820 [Sergentomyia squamirostris]